MAENKDDDKLQITGVSMTAIAITCGITLITLVVWTGLKKD